MPKSVWPRHLEHLAGVLFPSRCLGCARLSLTTLTPLGLCVPCRGRIRTLRPPVCRFCCEPLAAACAPSGFVCLACRNAPGPLVRLIAMWRYEPPVAEVVQALKFSDRADLASPLGTMLADRVRSEDLVLDDVVPVPLHWRRRLARGYDQAEAIARNVADRLGLVMTRALRRVRSTRPQSRLERRERPLNVRSAFQTRRGVSVEGRRILLVDDVVTSAATLHSAATALSRRGAGPVVGAVIARTPKPGGGPPQASSARHRTSGRRFL